MHKYLKHALPLLPFICFMAGYIISNLVIGTSSHKAPHIVGLTIHEALKTTSQNHVTIRLVAEKECLGTIPGTILTQKPLSGRLMKPNQTILVTVSKQPAIQNAPNFLSKNAKQIAEISKENGIKIKQYSLHSLLPQGTCIGQTPQPNASLNDKKMVLYIAQEKQNLYIMPNFIEKKLDPVIRTLQYHQLDPTIIFNHEKINGPYKENIIVVAQKPLAGSFISLNSGLSVQLEVQEMIN